MNNSGIDSRRRRPSPLLPLAVVLLPILLLATANSAGYRYGASDLAFYAPAVMRAVEPDLFPRDAPLIHAQARLTMMDETLGLLVRLTGASLPSLFLVLYLGTLALLAAASAVTGAELFRSRWTIAAFLLALTLRHAIPKSGTNTLEAYFHPRQLAFAFGVTAVATFLRGGTWLAALALAAAALLHPTTSLWFVMWLGVATFVSERGWRVSLASTAVLVPLGLVAAATWWEAGPLAGRLQLMDSEWLGTLAGKDYLFPTAWPLAAWLLNLAYSVVIIAVHRARVTAGLASARETALVTGALSLVPLFLVAVILTALRLAVAIQLQPARIFWMLDFIAIAYVVWALAEGGGPSPRRARVVAAAVLAVAVARGVYVMRVEFPGRPLFQIGVPGDWGRVGVWASQTPRGSAWLADPAHASRYGTSLRVSARRDVFVEAVKDAAIGMYDRAVAIRTRDRLSAVGDFAALNEDRVRDLASAHALDYLVTERPLALPLAFQAGAIRVYALRGSH